MIPVFYTAGLEDLVNRWRPAQLIVETGGTVLGDPIFTSTPAASLLLVGMTVSSSEFPVGTTILSVVGDQVTMSANATATVAGPGSTVTGILPAGLLGVFTLYPLQGGIPQDPSSLFAEFDTAILTAGILPLALTQEANGLSGIDGVLTSFACIEWQPTDSLTPSTITGILFTLPGTPDPIVICSQALDAPVVLATPADLLKIVPALSLTYLPGTQGSIQL